MTFPSFVEPELPDFDNSGLDNLPDFEDKPVDFGALFSGLEVVAETMTGLIEEVILGDKQDGKANQIAYVLGRPKILGRLVEEGTIDLSHFQNSTGEDGFIAVFHNVVFLGEKYIVKIATEQRTLELMGEYGVATMTADNQVV